MSIFVWYVPLRWLCIKIKVGPLLVVHEYIRMVCPSQMVRYQDKGRPLLVVHEYIRMVCPS